jgi:hypothetical protein
MARADGAKEQHREADSEKTGADEPTWRGARRIEMPRDERMVGRRRRAVNEQLGAPCVYKKTM